MNSALAQFSRNKTHVEEYGRLYSLINTSFPTLATQGEELLRAQIVMAVSALDSYLHDIVRIGLIQVFSGTRAISSASSSYEIPFSDMRNVISATTTADQLSIMEGAIIRINSKDSYQSPKSIEYAMSLLGVSSIWSNVAPSFGMTADDVKTELGNIVRRRNQIAHESDLDPISLTKYPISKSDADHVVDFIDKLVNAIHLLL